MSNKVQQALEVLERAKEQLISEIATCGFGGGVGRAQNYAPALFYVSECIKTITPQKSVVKVSPDPTPVVDTPVATSPTTKTKAAAKAA